MRVLKYFDDLASLPFTILARFTGSTCKFFLQQANQLLYEINETIFRASLIIDGRIQEVELAVNSVVAKQNIIAQPDGSLILKVDGNPNLPPAGAPFAFSRSTKLIAEGIGISEALLLRFREAGIGDHVVKQLKDGFDPTPLDEIIPIFESGDLTKALNQKLADDFVKDIDNFGREIVGRPELVRGWGGLINRPEWVRLNTDLLEKISGEGEEFIRLVDEFYRNFVPKNIAPPGFYNGVSYNKFGFPILTNHSPGRKFYFTGSLVGRPGSLDNLNAMKWLDENNELIRDVDYKWLGDGENAGKGSVLIKHNGEWRACTWHHHEDGRTLMPVFKDIHDMLLGKHTGGATIIKNRPELIGLFKSP